MGLVYLDESKSMRGKREQIPISRLLRHGEGLLSNGGSGGILAL
jgi:hypothetical protein